MEVSTVLLQYASVLALALFRGEAEAIMNGRDPEMFFGFHASLTVKYVHRTAHRCTASVVSWHYAMTAAHCLIYRVRLYGIKIKLDFQYEVQAQLLIGVNIRNVIKHDVVNSVFHQNFTRLEGADAWNIGMVISKERLVTEEKYFMPYRVGPSNTVDLDTEKAISEGLQCDLYSWGSPDLNIKVDGFCVQQCPRLLNSTAQFKVQKVQIKSATNEECCNNIDGTAQDIELCKKTIRIKYGLRCMKSVNVNSSTTLGDEGGAIICEHPKEKFYVHGMFVGGLFTSNKDRYRTEIYTEIHEIRSTLTALIQPLSGAVFIQANPLVTFICVITMAAKIKVK